MLHKTAFSLDTELYPEPHMQAYSTGETWNGFGCPIVTRGQLLAYIEQIRRSPLNDFYVKDTLKWSVDSHGVLHIPYEDGEYWDIEPSYNEELDDNVYVLGGWLCWFEGYEMSDHVRAICSELNSRGYSTDILTDQRFERGVIGYPIDHCDTQKDSENLPEWIKDNYEVAYEDDSISITEK